MTRPTKVTVLGQTFSVEYVSRSHLGSDAEKHSVVGRALISRQQLLVVEDQGFDQERDTVLHEVCHAIIDLQDLITDEDDKERITAALVPVLLGVLRDNPGLVAYLQETRQ